MTETINEDLLEERFAALEAAQAWSPRVVSKLEVLIRSGDDDDLFRINSLSYAETSKMAEPEAIDLFLHAVNVGLFDMEWLDPLPINISREIERRARARVGRIA